MLSDHRRVLLLSNSTCHGHGYLDHAEAAIREHLAGVGTVTFVPYALADWDEYARVARERLEQLGCGVQSLHEVADPRTALATAEAVFIGGGNTFRLLRRLYDAALLEPIRRRVADGMPYLGSSAGSNVAAASIRTTNDMPIVEVPSFTALALVPFNLNPHYLDPDPGSTHMGETREQRIRQFHEENANPVLGLREGGWLLVEGGRMTLGGGQNARLFRRGQEPEECPGGADLSFLLA